MELINDLVEIESADTIASGGTSFTWSGSDEARAARAAVEARIDVIRMAVNDIPPGTYSILTALDGDE